MEGANPGKSSPLEGAGQIAADSEAPMEEWKEVKMKDKRWKLAPVKGSASPPPCLTKPLEKETTIWEHLSVEEGCNQMEVEGEVTSEVPQSMAKVSVPTAQKE